MQQRGNTPHIVETGYPRRVFIVCIRASSISAVGIDTADVRSSTANTDLWDFIHEFRAFAASEPESADERPRIVLS